MSLSADRRRLSRVHFDTPVSAKVAASRVVLLDLSTEGARFEHSFPLARGRELLMQIEHAGTSVRLRCTVMRCKYERHEDKVAYYSGVHFSEVVEGSFETLRAVITSVIERDFEARRQHMVVNVRPA